jgi:RimJ/RimL family protein N-acetyltransferase
MNPPRKFTTKSGTEGIIREAEPSDARAIIEHLNEVGGESEHLTFGAGGFTKSIEDEERFITESHESANRLFLIALMDEDIAGIITVTASPKERINHIGEFGMSVRAKHWGQGIGTALLTTVIAWAKANGIIRKLGLYVNTNNTRAVALYEKLGFEREGTIRRDSCIDGRFYDAYAMGLLIDPEGTVREDPNRTRR